MSLGFQERVKEAGHLASNMLIVMKTGWNKDRSIASKTLKYLWKLWSAVEDIFPRLSKIRRFCWGVITKYYRDDCFSYASSLSFWFLISLLPLSTLFFKILEVFMGDQAFFHRTREVLMNIIPFVPESFLNDAVTHSREVGNNMGFAWIVLLMGSYWGVNQLDKSLAHVFGVRIRKRLQTRKNHILRQMSLLVGGLIVLALVLALLVGGVRNLSPTYQTVLMGNLPIIIALVATTLIFQYVPRVHIDYRHAFMGAVVSTSFWAVAKWAFKIYINNVLTWDIMYGSLLSIIAGLTFLYYTCAILLLGAEVTAAFYRKQLAK